MKFIGLAAFSSKFLGQTEVFEQFWTKNTVGPTLFGLFLITFSEKCNIYTVKTLIVAFSL